MQMIRCPHCGPREETEFHYGAAAGVAYPERPADLDDTAWAHYLFFRPNPKGAMTERWCHTTGCRQWFTVGRDTLTYAFTDESAPSRSRADTPSSPAEPGATR